MKINNDEIYIGFTEDDEIFFYKYVEYKDGEFSIEYSTDIEEIKSRK
jgi:hypothetical protein